VNSLGKKILAAVAVIGGGKSVGGGQGGKLYHGGLLEEKTKGFLNRHTKHLKRPGKRIPALKMGGD